MPPVKLSVSVLKQMASLVLFWGKVLYCDQQSLNYYTKKWNHWECANIWRKAFKIPQADSSLIFSHCVSLWLGHRQIFTDASCGLCSDYARVQSQLVSKCWQKNPTGVGVQLQKYFSGSTKQPLNTSGMTELSFTIHKIPLWFILSLASFQK